MALCGAFAQLKKQLSFLSSKAWAQALLILAQGWVYWLAWGAIYELAQHLRVKPYSLKSLSQAGKKTCWHSGKGNLAASMKSLVSPVQVLSIWSSIHLCGTRYTCQQPNHFCCVSWPIVTSVPVQVGLRKWQSTEWWNPATDIDLNLGTQKFLAELVEKWVFRSTKDSRFLFVCFTQY